MTLIWSPESIHDLISLRADIAEHDPAAAKRVALHVLYCVEHLLSENPQLGNPGRVPGTRELVIPKTPLHRSLSNSRDDDRNHPRVPQLSPLARAPIDRHPPSIYTAK
jgi:toxin ParE1/3/4